MRLNTCLVAALAVVVLGAGGLAGQAEAGCTISTAGVAFGTYDVFAASAMVSTGTISLTCNKKEKDVSIFLSSGLSGTYTARTMRGPGGDALTYNLFLQPFSLIWGDGTGGTTFHTVTRAIVGTVNVIMYGLSPAGQDVRAGLYTDTVVATVNF